MSTRVKHSRPRSESISATNAGADAETAAADANESLTQVKKKAKHSKQVIKNEDDTESASHPASASASIQSKLFAATPASSSSSASSAAATAASDATSKSFPIGVSVKVASLRPQYPHLKAWCANPSNHLATRHGRVFISEGASKFIFNYPASPWSNPYKCSTHTLQASLRKYEAYLRELVHFSEEKKQQFLKLKQFSQIGCFCDTDSPCHRDVILKVLREVDEESKGKLKK